MPISRVSFTVPSAPRYASFLAGTVSSLMRFAAAVFFTLAIASALHADLLFTATGVMYGTDFGYGYHQPASFTFTVSENAIYGSNYLTETYDWIQLSSDPHLFTDVSGTGLTVTSPSLSADSGSTTANAGSLFGTPYFVLHALVSAVGPDNTTPITNISLAISSTAFNFGPVSSTIPTPYQFLKSLAGSYLPNQFDTDSMNLEGPGSKYNTLNIASLSIVDVPGPGPSPVPEIDPAGMGSILALLTGGLGLLERRRRRA